MEPCEKSIKDKLWICLKCWQDEKEFYWLFKDVPDNQRSQLAIKQIA